MEAIVADMTMDQEDTITDTIMGTIMDTTTAILMDKITVMDMAIHTGTKRRNPLQTQYREIQ